MYNYNYNPVTPNAKNQMSNNLNTTASINSSFSQNRPLIDPQDYSNRNNTLHNNLTEKLLSENITEYRICINTIDRDTKTFPSPFNIKTSFGNSNYEPHIEHRFKNIKYITLNSVIVPRTIAIDTSKTIPNSPPPMIIPPDYLDIYPTSSHIINPIALPNSGSPLNILKCQPYLMLKIKELGSDNVLGSSPLYDHDTFMLIRDQELSDMYLYKPRRTTVVYPNSLLSNLSQLTLQITDMMGDQLSIYDQNGNDILNKPMGTYITDNYNDFVEKHKCNNKYVKYTNSVTQVIYDFTYGVVENELNTVTKYN